MIVVTGASGQLGHQIVQNLAGLMPADQIGVSLRDPAKAGGFAAMGIRVRQGDFSDAASLRHSFEGAAQVLIVSSNAAAAGGDPLAQHRTAIEAARAAGVGRVIYTSHMAASATSAFPPMRDHAATEDMLRQSGLAWTALRHGFYASSGLMMMGAGFDSGVLAVPQDGPVSWTAHADLAAAAALILRDAGRFDGPTPPLCGPEALDFAGLVEIASGLQAKSIRREVVADDVFRSGMAARQVPDRVVEIAMGFYRAARNGEFTSADPNLAQLLDRPLVTMRDLMVGRLGV